ncbi:ParB/RepB/Spo0J family partition protein [Paenibacillus sp. HJGM_3]|uniref:ParB/RepB/Spo0J family partition protein n=1 Tax=Paenibacillus sp. HJGM_3 TaxID=3379816 RepID=UPI00385E51CB
MNIIELPIGLIDEDTDQPRYQFDETALQELMNSIAELGLLSPIKVRATSNGRYKIIYGNRRFKAVSTLNRPTIPCIISQATDDMEIYLEQIAENLTREGFSPIEEAEAFHKLLHDPKFSSSVKFLSSKLGKPEAFIKNKVELLKFGQAVRKLIVSGSEIRKDKLTEEQLLPLKDLAIEHRDPLALIIARDEMPVSDAKKLANLFKATDISDNTKGKLLLKTGRDLLETWYTYKQNKAEREKEIKPKAGAKAAAKADKPAVEAAGAGGAAGEAAASPAAGGAGATAASPAAGGAGATAASPAAGGAGQAGASTAAAQSGSAVPGAARLADELAAEVRELLSQLPPRSPLKPELLGAYADMEASAQARLMRDVEALIDTLEFHLAEWKAFRARD